MQDGLWAAPQLPLRLILTVEVQHELEPDRVRLLATTIGTKRSGVVWADDQILQGPRWPSIAAERFHADVLRFGQSGWASAPRRTSQADWEKHLFAW